MIDKISLYGHGFVGKWMTSLYPNKFVVQDRDDLVPNTNNILWGISTISNYHVYTNPYLDIDTNLTLLIKMLETCKGLYGNSFFVTLLSSWFVYGKTMINPVYESYPCRPSGFYSSTALCREQLLESYCKTFGINYRILRLPNVIGVGDKKVGKHKNALQYMIRELVNGREVKIYKGQNVRDYVDVRDVVRAVVEIIMSSPDTYNQIYNISNGVGWNISEIVHRVARSLGREDLVGEMDVPEFHKIVQIQRMYMNNGKIKALGYEPKYKMSETLDWIIEDYKNE
jgi:nucleoside-diphosphate-sugar epimerase